MQVLNRLGINPKSGVYNYTLDLLASEHLEMQMLCNLGFYKDNNIVHLFSTDTRYYYDFGDSDIEIEKKKRAAIEKRGLDQLAAIQNKLSKSRAACEIVHFICGIKAKGQGHAILLSLVQNKSGRGLFLWDNMNLKVDDRSQTKHYIDYLCHHLQVSTRRQFKLPLIPDRWPSAPTRGGTWF